MEFIVYKPGHTINSMINTEYNVKVYIQLTPWLILNTMARLIYNTLHG
jgi:hypothetical protein